jgi:L-fuconolactonase
VIDAHVHVWDDRLLDEYDWMTDRMTAIRRPFGLEDLRPALAANGMDGVVLVQTCSSLDETRDLLALAETSSLVAGVVGWVDLAEPRIADVLDELRAGRGGDALVGIRHQVHDEPDPEWLLRPDVQRGLRMVEHAGLAYDLLVRPRELPAALDVARRFGGLRLVIDHIGKPPIAAGELEPWASRIAPFAELDHVMCKISGLVTEADWESWTASDLEPYLSRVVDWFGPSRIVFGSDWPVCLLAASYDEVFATAKSALGDLAPLERNARALYRLS